MFAQVGGMSKSEPKDWTATLKPGDKVAMATGGAREANVVAVVQGLREKHVAVTNPWSSLPNARPLLFRRQGAGGSGMLFEAGARGYNRTTIRPLTPEVQEAIANRKRLHDVAGVVWGEQKPETIAAVHALLFPAEGS